MRELKIEIKDKIRVLLVYFMFRVQFHSLGLGVDCGSEILQENGQSNPEQKACSGVHKQKTLHATKTLGCGTHSLSQVHYSNGRYYGQIIAIIWRIIL